MALIYPIPPVEDGDPYAFAPIRAAAPATPRRGALLASIATPALLILAGLKLAISRPDLVPPSRGPRSVAVQLHEAWPFALPPRPIEKAPEGPGQAKDLPGLGHVDGTGTIDPALLALPEARRPVVPSDDPDGLRPQSPLPPIAGLNRQLPVAPGGNGLARGTGKDAGAGGHGPGWRGPDYKLVLVHEEFAETDVPINSPGVLVPVKVLVLIGASGRPLSAQFISGPEQLKSNCIQAALRFQWEPLGPHGLQAPVEMILTFHPIPRGTGRQPQDRLARR